MRGFLLTCIVLALIAPPITAEARPPRPSHKRALIKRSVARAKATRALKQTAKARVVAVSILGAARPAAEKRPKTGPLTPEQRIADAIETLYKGPLRAGTTSLYVADARTGAPVFAVDPEAGLNPASNVKLISTAAALDLLGPDFRYLTRVLGRAPDKQGAVQDLYLLGSFDPTLRVADVHKIAADLVGVGVRRVDGDIVVGPLATRDGLFRALVPVEIIAADKPDEPPMATVPAGYDFVVVKVTAKTSKKKRGRLAITEQYITDAAGHKRLEVTIGGTMGKGKTWTHWVWTKERALHAAHAMRAGLRAAGVEVRGDVRVEEFEDVVANAATAGWIPLELVRHESARLGDIVAQVNKRSINWLADRVIMTAAARAYGGLPSMEIAIEAMYRWLGAHTTIPREKIVVDSGSGLSRRTRFSAKQIVDVMRTAAGFAPGPQPVEAAKAQAYLSSLSVGGVDGTLKWRFKNSPAATHLLGKTGTLHDVVALAGFLQVDPQRPLAFALITNGHSENLKVRVKRAHEDLVGLLCSYVQASLPAGATPTVTAAPGLKPSAGNKRLTVPPMLAPVDPKKLDGKDHGFPEASPDREDIDYMGEQEVHGPIIDPRVPTDEESDETE